MWRVSAGQNENTEWTEETGGYEIKIIHKCKGNGKIYGK